MENQFARDVYDTVRGQLKEEFQVTGVKNTFAPGEKCDLLYEKVYDAERRLEARLGVPMHDEDVETIIDALLQIQEELCLQMYRYGAQFGLRE